MQLALDVDPAGASRPAAQGVTVRPAHHDPAGHGEHDAAPAAESVPAAQGRQAAAPAAGEKKPAVQLAQDAAPATAEAVPAWHEVQLEERAPE